MTNAIPSIGRSASWVVLFASVFFLASCGKETPQAEVIASTPLAAIDTPKPDYPIEIACANFGGTAVFNVMVGIEGKPVQVKLLASSGQAKLDASAEKAVHTWIFEAATRNGKAVTQAIQVPVKFTPPVERPSECFALDSAS